MLTLKNITKVYKVTDNDVKALNGIDVSFRKTEFVSVLGPSGCGKTTLMNIIGGLDKSTSGDLVIDGKSTVDFTSADWDNYRNKKIGFVFQTYNLIPHLSVLKNVELALTLSGVNKVERRQKAEAALEKVGLSQYLRQKPNQLSGGQMQRVAIARAIVNSPEILLADEPTGALDSETSVQIMDLLKEISMGRLVVMVTHNPELAERYSTRLIKMLDGKIMSDSLPYTAAEIEKETQEAQSANESATAGNGTETQITVNATESLNYVNTENSLYGNTNEGGLKGENAQSEGNQDEINKRRNNLKRGEKKKSAMSFFTALSLSGRNLMTKRGRTALTAIAGSIGIIGIALILAISGGMNDYINKIQADTLSSNPITISERSINIEQAMSMFSGDEDAYEKFPEFKKILVKEVNKNAMLTKNNITDEYIDYLKNKLNPNLYNDILFKTGMDLNFYGKKTDSDKFVKLSSSDGSWQLLPDKKFVSTQYDVLDGEMPDEAGEISIIVDETNRISESTLVALGIKNVNDGVTEYNFDDIMDREYKLVSNDLLYFVSNGSYYQRNIDDIDFDSAVTLKVSAILRINNATENGVLSAGIGYTKAMYEEYQRLNFNSAIVGFMLADRADGGYKNPLYLNEEFEDKIGSTKEEQWSALLRQLGGIKTPNNINVYPVSFEAKNAIKDFLSAYNEGRAENDIVTYTDMSEIIGSAMSTMIDIISYILIAFTAISLVVSSIMIGIITYVSVLERTKEIGVLRSIGARKKDVTRLFNAETCIIGLMSGAIGVIIAYVLSVPINAIIKSLTGVGSIAALNPAYAFLLIAVSVCLTLISGLIPAVKAAKQDPVNALRTE